MFQTDVYVFFPLFHFVVMFSYKKFDVKFLEVKFLSGVLSNLVTLTLVLNYLFTIRRKDLRIKKTLLLLDNK